MVVMRFEYKVAMEKFHIKTLGTFLMALTLLLCVYFVGRSAGPKTIQSYIEPDEYLIYSAFVSQFAYRARTKLVVIAEKTMGQDSWEFKYNDEDWGEQKRKLIHEMHLLKRGTLDDFYNKNKNRQRYQLSNDFHLQMKYLLVDDQKQIENLKRGSDWENFYRHYPDSQGLMFLSRVGFNRAKDQALMYFSNRSSVDGGGGEYLMFLKIKGRWKEKARMNLWIS